MSSNDPCAGGCTPLPDAQTRLRYFFGKRLGVADFKDEQAYHRGRMNLHNRHLHGVGVVCGLGLSRFDAGDPSDTVVRVGRGLALDSCGREILVPVDQCIDLAAWLRASRSDAERRGQPFPPEGSGDRLRVCVCLRYVECPTTPEPAPQDPCATVGGGCEYGRVVEGFELDVALAEEGTEAAPSSWVDALGEAPDLAALEAAVAERVAQGCAEDDGEGWVQLGCLEVMLGEEGVTALSEPEGWGGPAHVVLSTALLQELLLGLLGLQGGDAAEDVPSEAVEETPSEAPPEVAPAAQALTLLDEGVLRLALEHPLLPATLNPEAVSLRRLERGQGWRAPERLELQAREDELGPGLLLRVPDGAYLSAGGPLRLHIHGGAEPLLDDQLRALRVDLGFSLKRDDAGAWVLTVTDDARAREAT